MKKKIIVILIIVLALIGISYFLYTKDNIRFKFSYEMLNGEKISRGKPINLKIPYDNRVKYLKEKEINKFLDSGTGVLYLGYSSCPWCRNIVPILIDVVKDNNLKRLYYIDIHNTNIKNTNLVEKLNDFLREDENNKKVIAAPDVYVIKDGKVLSHHLGTVDSYKNPYSGMNEDEKSELRKIYNDMIKEVK